ncbi:hypothetical protein WCQ02_21840 [Paraburkholderia tropica]|uniref:hypothetical protein n=1 Tax=Paraburkholderia tropica TaxID=92647 RepID=UPI00301655A0
MIEILPHDIRMGSPEKGPTATNTPCQKLSLAIILCLGIPCNLSAGELAVFSNPGLVVFRSEGQIQGYYSALEAGRSCEFFFNTHSQVSWPATRGQVNSAEIGTFALGLGERKHSQRNSDFYISGVIKNNADEWSIQTDVEPPGCGGGVGVFSKNTGLPPFRFFEKSTFRGKGIRVVNGKTYLYNKIKGRLSKRKEYLTENDIVSVISDGGGYSNIRYVNPDYFVVPAGKVTIGWVRTRDLVDPFPPMSRP